MLGMLTYTMVTTSFFYTNPGGILFEIDSKNDLIIDSLDVEFSGAATDWFKVYYREGTYVGHETTIADWALLDSITVTSLATPSFTGVKLTKGLYIPAGSTYGICVIAANGVYYVNGTFAATVEDSNMVVNQGAGCDLFASFLSPRFFKGQIHYSVRNVDEIAPGAQTGSNAGNARGYCFQATKDFRIVGAMVPTDVPGNQSVSIIRLNAQPPVFPAVTNNLVTLGYHTGMLNGSMVPFDVFVAKGDWIGVYAEGDFSSYSDNDTLFVVLGDTIDRIRSGMQFDMTLSQMHDVWSEPSYSAISRVQLYIEPVTLHGGPDSVLIDVQTPAPDLGADGDYCVQNIVTLDPGTFSSYDWSTAESTPTIDVDTAGVPLNAPFDIWVTVTDQYGCTGSDTITISFIDCTGIDENDITVSVYPNPSDDVFYLKADNVQDEMLVQVFGLDGRLVKEVVLNETFGSIDMSNELPGVYSIRITIKDQVKEMRVVLQ